MTNRKNTRRALVLSLLSLLLCCSMLVGTTFAWFTDSVTSGNNRIIAGNLDIELYYDNGTEYVPVTSDVNLLESDLWEPGHVEVVNLKIANLGTLALKYQFQVTVINETSSVNQNGESFRLSNHIQFALLKEEVKGTREELVKAAESKAVPLNGLEWTEPGVMLADAGDEFVTLVAWMPEEVGNEANYKSGAIQPTIILGVNLFATQMEAEFDSFGNDYDADAQFPMMSADDVRDAFHAEDGADLTNKIRNIVFGKPSDYAAVVDGNEPISEPGADVTVYRVANSDNTYDVYYLSEEPIKAPADSSNLFNGMAGVTAIDTSNLDMSTVVNALCMFTNCSNLETLDTANWDVSNITNMQSMFYGCNKLEDIDVSNWDTSNVTNMRMVFFRCYELPNEVLKGVENWDVSNVSNFYSMFKQARGLTSLDLSKWDTSSAVNMSHMFANIGGVEYLDLSGFDTSKVTDMSWMFYDASKLTTILVGDGWTTAALDPANPTAFYNNQALVGGAGTTWLDVCDMANSARPWESSAKIVYAIVDGGAENPGLLTHK